MAQIKPFRALRPIPRLAARVAALPYDVMTSAEARVYTKDNPYSFLHVDKPEVDLPESLSVYDPQVYAKAKENLDKMTANGIFIRDAVPCLYIYALAARGRVQTGLACCVGVEDYTQGLIKKHELTRNDKEQDRIKHVNACSAHTGPIFLTYRAQDEARAVLNDWTANHAPEYDFTAEDAVRHTLWVVDDSAAIAAITKAFAHIPALYIADGHHRTASAAQVAQQRRAALDAAVSADTREFDCFLSVIFPDDELTIMDYNRLVSDLNGMDVNTLCAALADCFAVQPCDEPVKPEGKHIFGMYVQGQWYRLRFTGLLPQDTVDALDVAILQHYLLAPVLGIDNPQTDKRIDFVGGIRGLQALTQRVDSGEMAAAFTLFPTTLEDLMAVADADRIMPPKSTWFEPKLRSGLLIHTF